MAFAQQIGFGGMNFSPMNFMGGGGLNHLFGNMMGGMGMSGFGGGMDMYSMYQMMSQMMGGQGGGAAQPGVNYPVWQSQMPQYQQVQAQQPQQPQQAGNGREFNPNQDASPHDQYLALKAHASANGSQDGTPIASWTSVQQDIGAAQYAGQLASKQSGVVGKAIEAATPDEQKALKAEEERLAKLFTEASNQGHPISQQQRDLVTSQAIDKLYTDGTIGKGVGEANKKYLELNQFQSQTEANLYLKWGQPMPADMSRDAVAKSPFNKAAQK